MPIILGINTHHADSSAAILADGKLVFAIAEERLNRKKHYGGFPSGSIQACLDSVGIRIDEVDYVALGRDRSANISQKLRYVLANPFKIPNLMRIGRRRASLDSLGDLVSVGLGIDPERIRFKEVHVEHHLAHIASAFYASPYEQCAGFSYDGSGDFVSAMGARCTDREIEILDRTFLPASLGSFYSTVCTFIGYHQYGDEGKVMGLAPYGSDTYREFFDGAISLDRGGLRLDETFFAPLGANQGLRIDDDGKVHLAMKFTDAWEGRFGPPRAPYVDISQRDMDLASGMQRKFEEIALAYLRRLHGRVPVDRLALAGGCALNSVLNGKISAGSEFEETYIQPAAGDEGLALGAALYVWHQILGHPRDFCMEHPFWGPEYSDSQIRDALESEGVQYQSVVREALLDATSRRLAEGDVVGWFQGRMEWGPRALGNRSILAHPGRDDMKDVLNARVKRREWFRPFAPSILAEYQDEYFECSHPSPFMLHVYKIRPDKRPLLPAVNHVDDTGRLQSVSRHENALYYDLIQAFHRRTGLPVVLNTSFNENEPIVCSPAEAIQCFKRTRMDVLSIGNFIATKDGNSHLPREAALD